MTFAQIGPVEAVRQLLEESGFQAFKAPLRMPVPSGEACVCASVTLLEGIDFDLVYFPLKHLGYKAVVRAAGELYAALATPKTLSVSLGVSAKLDFPQIRELWSGVAAAAREHGFEALDLQLQASRNGLSLHLAACGCCEEKESPKAASKDLLCVSGSLGAAFLGLKLLERERSKFEQRQAGAKDTGKSLEAYKMLVAAYLKPEMPARVRELLSEAGIRPAGAYLVTHGLADTLLRIRRDSGLGVKVYADKIPFEGNSFALGKELNVDPVSAAMNGGEDLRLLFIIPIGQYERFRKDFQTFDIIGHLARPEAGAVLVTPDGLEHTVSAPGWPEDASSL